jgi:hypothetical protein
MLRRLSTLNRSARIECEIEEELRFHLEMRTRDHLDSGMTPEQARVEALRRFGDFERIKDACHEISREKLANRFHLRAIKGFIWILLGSGLSLRAASSLITVQHVGDVLAIIAILWRLLIYLRVMQPIKHHVHTKGGQLLILAEAVTNESNRSPGILEEITERQIHVRDQHGRTPVERLLADDE